MQTKTLAQKTSSNKRRNWFLILIFFLGLGFRFHGLDWGIPHYFHPDERQVMFQTMDLNLKNLNPKFFAYGSLPLYFLKGTAVTLESINDWLYETLSKTTEDPGKRREYRQMFPKINNFKQMVLTGRVISAFLSAWTILIIFKIAQLLYNRKVGLIAASLFAFCVLSIQQAHFYVVDGPQTFLLAYGMYFLVKIAIGNRNRDYYYAAIFIGLAMATKFSTLPVYLSYFVAQICTTVKSNRKKVISWIHWVLGGIGSVMVMTAAMPYWILDNEKWFRDVREQSRMVRGIARLPYTIQYEHTEPFWYLIKNMVLWSAGLPLGIALFAGFTYALIRLWKKHSDVGNIVLLAYVVPIFYLNSTFQVKFLRYTLPLMAFLTIFAAKWLHQIQSRGKYRSWGRFVSVVVIGGAFLWALAFSMVYRQPNTRVQASNWVYQNIPKGSTILIESNWDDALPVGTDEGNPGQYKHPAPKLEIYREPDNARKARDMAVELTNADVIILASKRHYGSVMRVPDRFPISTNFYKSLFAEKLGYKYVKSFTEPPRLGPMKFNDDLADESFRVYEHPKVCIFVKETALSEDVIYKYIVQPPLDAQKLTYDDILVMEPTTQIGSSVNFPILRWLLLLEILGLIVFPSVFIVFSKFDHRGYPLTKAIGLLLTGYFTWLLPSLHFFKFSQMLGIWVITLVFIGNFFIYQRNRAAMDEFVKKCWWSIAGYELLFLSVFAVFALLKSYNPDIFWSESSMDFGFINSILRADYFPPPDPWITGQTVSYYYFGHYLTAFMTMLSGVVPAYGYNLFFITIPALVALSVGSIVITLTRRLWAGLIAVIFSIFIGNLDGIAQTSVIWANLAKNTSWAAWAGMIKNFTGYFLVLGRTQSHFRFFRSAHELIPATVHEFPFWSYNFMDLHAHTIATFISTLILALHFVLYRNNKSGTKVFGPGLQGILTFSILCISLGALIPTNTWDFPTHCLIIFIILFVLPTGKKLYRYSTYKVPIAQHIEELSTIAEGDALLEQPVVDAPVPEAEICGATEQNDGLDLDESNDSGPEIIHHTDESSEAELSRDALPKKESNEPQPESENGDPGIENVDIEGTEENVESTSDEDDKLEFHNEPHEEESEKNEELYFEKKNVVPENPETEASEPDISKKEFDELVTVDDFSDDDVVRDEEEIFHEGDFEEVDSESDLFPEEELEEDIESDTEIQAITDSDSVPNEVIPLVIIPRKKRKISGIFLNFFIFVAELIRDIWIPLLGVIVVSYALYLPYMQHFSRQGMGIGFLLKYKDYEGTKIQGFLTMFGLFVFIFVTLLIKWWFITKKRLGHSVPRIAISALLAAVGYSLIIMTTNLLFRDYNNFNSTVFVLSAGLALTILSIYFRGNPTSSEKFALLFAFVAVGITAGTELVFIKDFYQGGGHRRFNTVFKFYMQAWFLFSIASAFLVANRFKVRKIGPSSSKLRLISGCGRWLWNILFIFLLAGSFIFTVQGPRARRHHDEYARIDLPMTLDGLAYMKAGSRQNEYRAIRWINDNISGYPTVLEASKKDYLYDYGRVSANTGLQSVLGWWSHVDQREYSIDSRIIKMDIQEIFSGDDIPKTLELLRKYNVEYIFVGITEMRDYPECKEKFSLLTDYMTPVYTNPDVVIFRVNEYGIKVDFSQAASGNDALKQMQERIKANREREKLEKLEENRRRTEARKNAKPMSMYVGGEGDIRGQFSEPRSLCIDTQGFVYVADFRNHRIQKFDLDGKWLTMWGTSGEKPGQFGDICDIAVDSAGVYVLDTFNNRVQKFSPEGKFLGQWLEVKDSFFYPRGIVADQNGYIYVADTGHHRIVKLNNKGEFIKEWGRLGDQPGNFENPIGLSIFKDKLYVADTVNQRIEIFDLDGKFIKQFPFNGWEGTVFVEPYIAVADEDNIYVSDPTGLKIMLLDAQGNVKKVYTKDYLNRDFNRPMGLFLDPNGDLLIVDTHNHRLTRLQGFVKKYHETETGKPEKLPQKTKFKNRDR